MGLLSVAGVADLQFFCGVGLVGTGELVAGDLDSNAGAGFGVHGGGGVGADGGSSYNCGRICGTEVTGF